MLLTETLRRSTGAVRLVLLCAALSASAALGQAANAPIDLPGVAPPARTQVQPHFLVVLDAAHGGADHGAHLGGAMEEKDLVLMLSIRLESMLKESGVEVVTTRQADTALAATQRAELADRSKAAACLSLHATESGSGVHLFTSSLAPTAPGLFVPWSAAQAPSIQQSLKLSAEINSAMTHAEIPVTLGRTSLQPLNSFTCPAVAVEIAPLSRAGSVSTPLSDSGYQNRIIGALSAAVESWKRDWAVQP